MTTLPISMPYVFANVTTTQRLAYLDADFATLTNAINGIGNGSVALSNVNITGGNVAASANSVPLSALQATGTLTSQHYLRGDGTWSGIASPAGGTVTSVNANSAVSGFSFTGGPIDVNGTLTLTGPSPGAAGNALVSNGTAWTSQTISTGTVTSVSGSGNYGFSLTGGPITASGTLTVDPPAPGTAGNVLTSNGTAWISSTSSSPIGTFGAIGSYVEGVTTASGGSPPGTILAGSSIACHYLNSPSAVNPPGTYIFMGAGDYSIGYNLFQRIY